VLAVSHRPLAIVSGLTIGDYLLWNWSLNGSHDVLALVSGLTLPPLAAALVWLIAVTAVRLLGRVTRQSPPRATTAASATRRKVRQSRSIARSRRELRRQTSAVQASTASPVPNSRSRQPSSAAQPSPSRQPRPSSQPSSSRKLAA
jgi:hypothetical protein